MTWVKRVHRRAPDPGQGRTARLAACCRFVSSRVWFFMNLFFQQQATLHSFDARGIGKRFRHAAIFGALDALQPGEAMRFVNDHDPLPLLAQLQQRYGDALAMEYRQREPGAVVIDFTVVAGDGGDDGCGCCGSCG
jgi:uncharacterized protein (DUF2249 family)